MYSLNRATLIGNLTRDPELRQIPSGQSVCTFGMATNRRWKDASGTPQEQADFHNVVCWGKLAEICGQYLSKGRKVYVEGRLQTRDWEGQDSVRRYRTEVVVDNMIILDRAGSSGTRATQETTPPSEKQAANDPSVSSEDEIQLEDIPF